MLDCLDGSDEDNCDMIIFDESNYKKSQQPKPKDGMLEITVGLVIQSVDNIQELTSNFRIQFATNISWKDNRLLFQNLQNNSQNNVLGSNIANALWIPSLTFPDSIGTNNVAYDKNSFLFVQKEGDGQVAGLEETHESIQYHGKNNPIVLNKRFQFLHNCHFDLKYFPFDLQNCQMKVNTKDYKILKHNME